MSDNLIRIRAALALINDCKNCIAAPSLQRRARRGLEVFELAERGTRSAAKALPKEPKLPRMRKKMNRTQMIAWCAQWGTDLTFEEIDKASNSRPGTARRRFQTINSTTNAEKSRET